MGKNGRIQSSNFEKQRDFQFLVEFEELDFRPDRPVFSETGNDSRRVYFKFHRSTDPAFVPENAARFVFEMRPKPQFGHATIGHSAGAGPRGEAALYWAQ